MYPASERPRRVAASWLTLRVCPPRRLRISTTVRQFSSRLATIKLCSVGSILGLRLLSEVRTSSRRSGTQAATSMWCFTASHAVVTQKSPVQRHRRDRSCHKPADIEKCVVCRLRYRRRLFPSGLEGHNRSGAKFPACCWKGSNRGRDGDRSCPDQLIDLF